MAKNVSNIKKKALKREKAKKKARRKTIIIISIFLMVVITAAVVGIHFRKQNNNMLQEEYSYRGQTVRLFTDGTFSARLEHNEIKEGTYTKTENVVFFNVDGREEIGRIIDNSLHIPQEWDDGHGHGTVFSRNR